MKKHRNLIFLSLVIFLLFILITIYFTFNNNKSCIGFNCLVFPDKSSWKVKDTYQDDKSLWRGLIEDKDYMVRLYRQGNVTTSEAADFTKVTTMKIKGLFDTAKSPYAGEISDKITCPDNLKPTEEDFKSKLGIQIHFMTSFLNDRLEYGACTENQISYKVFSGMFYCPEVSEWYQLELIVPLNTALKTDYYRNLFTEAGCQRPSLKTGRLLP